MSAQHRAAGPPGRGRAAVITLADQGISSGTNVVIGVLVARAGGATALGAYGIAYLLWLAVVATNRALVSEPLMVVGASDGDMQLREGMLATLVVGVAGAGGIVLIAGGLLAADIHQGALFALVPWLPSLLVQDYWRGMAFRQQRPGRALVNDGVYAVVQAAATLGAYAVHLTSAGAFIAAWGLGATAGAVVGLALSGVRCTPLRGGLTLLRSLWPRSRWFLGEALTAFLSDQGYLLLLPVFLGTAEFGIYRAGASLIGPAVVLFLAAGNLGLPGGVRALRDGGMPGLSAFTRRLGLAVVTLTGGYCAVAALVAGPVLVAAYGPGFGEGALVTRLVALQYVLFALGVACGVAAKAAGALRGLWAARAASAVLSISCMVLFARTHGLLGAGTASVLAGGSLTVGVVLVYRRLQRSLPENYVQKDAIPADQ